MRAGQRQWRHPRNWSGPRSRERASGWSGGLPLVAFCPDNLDIRSSSPPACPPRCRNRNASSVNWSHTPHTKRGGYQRAVCWRSSCRENSSWRPSRFRSISRLFFRDALPERERNALRTTLNGYGNRRRPFVLDIRNDEPDKLRAEQFREGQRPCFPRP